MERKDLRKVRFRKEGVKAREDKKERKKDRGENIFIS